MRFFSLTLGLLVAASAVDFALSNRDKVLIGFWPLVDAVEMPLYLAVMLSFGLGLVLGGAMTKLGHWRRRRAARKEVG